MNEPNTTAKEKWVTKQMVAGAAITIILGAIGYSIQQWLSASPNVTALCSSTEYTTKAYQPAYIDSLTSAIDKEHERAAIADSFFLRLDAVKTRNEEKPFPPSTVDVYSSLFDDLRKKYDGLGPSSPILHSDYDKNQALVTGEIKCQVSNTGSKKADDIHITFPSQPTSVSTGGILVPYDPTAPVVKIVSLNPGDKAVIAAQYGGYFHTSEYDSPPTVTFADGTSTIEMDRAFHGYAAKFASFAIMMHDIGWIFVLLAVSIPLLVIGITASINRRAHELSTNTSAKSRATEIKSDS